MPIATVSSKHQITVPAEIVRELKIKAGDKLVIEAMDGRIVAIPEPASWVDYLRGSARSLYGQTKQQVDRYVAEERAAWVVTGGDDLETFLDYYVAHREQEGGRLLRTLAALPASRGATARELREPARLTDDQVETVLREQLVPWGWVRSVSVNGDTQYRLRRDLAGEIPS